jgi:hypothetical protein
MTEMTEAFRKLNFEAQNPILTLETHESFAVDILTAQAETEIHLDRRKVLSVASPGRAEGDRRGVERAELLAG